MKLGTFYKEPEKLQEMLYWRDKGMSLELLKELSGEKISTIKYQLRKHNEHKGGSKRLQNRSKQRKGTK